MPLRPGPGRRLQRGDYPHDRNGRSSIDIASPGLITASNLRAFVTWTNRGAPTIRWGMQRPQPYCDLAAMLCSNSGCHYEPGNQGWHQEWIGRVVPCRWRRQAGILVPAMWGYISLFREPAIVINCTERTWSLQRCEICESKGSSQILSKRGIVCISWPLTAEPNGVVCL